MKNSVIDVLVALSNASIISESDYLGVSNKSNGENIYRGTVGALKTDVGQLEAKEVHFNGDSVNVLVS